MHIVSLVYLHCHLFAQKYWFPLILTKASWTDGPTDRTHNRPRDRPSYRDARTHLKTYDEGSFHYEDCCFLFLQKKFWICMLHQWRERSREMMIWTCKSKWFYHSYAKRKNSRAILIMKEIDNCTQFLRNWLRWAIFQHKWQRKSCYSLVLKWVGTSFYR